MIEEIHKLTLVFKRRSGFKPKYLLLSELSYCELIHQINTTSICNIDESENGEMFFGMKVFVEKNSRNRIFIDVA